MASLQKRERILITVAGTCLLSFLLNQLVCSGRADDPDVRKSQTVNEALAAESAPQPTTTSPVTARRPDVDRVVPDSWGRDPFALAYRLAPPDTTGVDSTVLELKGIIWRGNEAMALIGDAILREGQRAGALKVLDIDRNRVLCKHGKKLITLVLENE